MKKVLTALVGVIMGIAVISIVKMFSQEEVLYDI